ncbi:hypothetical protein ABIC83_002630 [Roseateles asaccharophilus]|uniref:hypothetical protein n=1 Tax=Roseateles asaccharophilus TaxID=582607 RepID=UPI003833EC22
MPTEQTSQDLDLLAGAHADVSPVIALHPEEMSLAESQDLLSGAPKPIIMNGLLVEPFVPRFPGDEEGLVGSGGANNPLNPHSERFLDPLNPEEFEPRGRDMPGIEPRRFPEITLNPDEMEAELQNILERARSESAEARHLVLEFGPFAGLEKTLRGMSQDLTDQDIGEVLMTKARRAIHDVVVSTDNLDVRETREEGLMARAVAIQEIIEKYQSDVVPFLDELRQAGMNVSEVSDAFDKTLAVEQKRLEFLNDRLVPATLGNQIFDHLAAGMQALVSGPSQLVGDVRRHRNDNLARALTNLTDITSEMRSNAGDPVWERANSAMSTEMAGNLIREVKGLVTGVEDQVDLSSVNRTLKNAGESLSFAADNAAEAEHKNRIEKMVEAIQQAIDAMMAALGRIFGQARDGNAKPNTYPASP